MRRAQGREGLRCGLRLGIRSWASGVELRFQSLQIGDRY